MWLHEPGSLTRIIAAMVIPRKTSSETMRAAGAVRLAAGAREAGAAMVCAVTIGVSSAGGDSTAAGGMPQRRDCGGKSLKKKNGRDPERKSTRLNSRHLGTS